MRFCKFFKESRPIFIFSVSGKPCVYLQQNRNTYQCHVIVIVSILWRAALSLSNFVFSKQVCEDFTAAFLNEIKIEQKFENFFTQLLNIRRKHLSAADQTFVDLLDGNITTGKFYNNWPFCNIIPFLLYPLSTSLNWIKFPQLL